MFSRCPRYFSQGPAIEMWSVVHLPLTLISSGSPVKSRPSHAGKGCRRCRRLLSGRMTGSGLPACGAT